MAFIKIFLLTLLIYFSFCERDISLTTKDPDFMSQYYVRHIKEGNKKMYPRMGDTVKINFKAFHPHTYKLLYTSERQPPYPVTLGGQNSMVCWDNIMIRMCKNEKIYAVCKAEHIWEGRGNDVIPGNTDIGWEIEIVSIKRKKKDEM